MGTVKRRGRKRVNPDDISRGAWALINDEPRPDDDGESWDYWFLDSYGSKRRLWEDHGERVLTHWIDQHPGTRPHCWWLYEAPRGEPGRFMGAVWADMMIEPRTLLKGDGRPAWERYAYAPCFQLGIPKLWTEGDPAELVFEPQYDYLKRHGLLVRGESRSPEPIFEPSRVLE